VDTLLGLLIYGGGAAVVAAIIAICVTQATLGSPLFFALTAVPCVVYGPPGPDRLSPAFS